MLRNKIVQTITGTSINSFLGFLCLIIIQKTGALETTEAYIKLTNYSLILLSIIEIGKSTYIAATPALNEITVKTQSIITILMIIIMGIWVHDIALGPEIIIACAGIYASKIGAAKYQRNRLWTQFNAINAIQNLAKLTAIIIIIIFGMYQVYIEAVVTAMLVAGILSHAFGRTQKMTYTKETKIDWGFLNYYGIGCVIAIAMRLDLIIIDYLLTDADFTAYGLMFQLSMVLPIITNSLMSVYLVDGVKSSKIIHPIRFTAILVLIAIPLYMTVEIASYYLFSISSQQYIISGCLIMLSGLGGIYYTKHEAEMYKHKPAAIFRLKISQTLIIASSFPVMLMTDWRTTIVPAFFVFASRVYAWSIIYASNKQD